MNRFSRILATTILILSVALAAPATATVEERVLIGAYDQAHINGLVFITNDQNFFGLRFLVYRPGAAIEDKPGSFQFGPHSPNGSYASVRWRLLMEDKTPVILRWSRLDKNVVIGRLSAPSNVRVAIEVYRPWSETDGDLNWATFWAQVDRRTILGEQVQNQKPMTNLRRFLLRTDRKAIGAGSYEDSTTMRDMLIKEDHAQRRDNGDDPRLYRHAVLSFDLSQDSSFGFVAAVGDNFEAMEREADRLLQRPVVESLDRAEKSYEMSRTLGSGATGDSFDLVSRTVNWNRFYDPEKQLEYIAVHRLAGDQSGRGLRGDVLSWDSFFIAMMASMIDKESATASIRELLSSQTPDGRMPLRRHLKSQSKSEPITLAGRSMPPIGSLCVWKIYLATSDLGLLAWAYPRLLQWNDWWLMNRGDGQAWRDGNGDGLLEWGFDAELEHGALGDRMISNSAKLKSAISESGLDDRPQWNNGEEVKTDPADPARQQNDEVKYNDRTHTIDFSPVGLNALYALDTEILMIIARELGLPTEADKLQTRYQRIKTLINDKLWSDADGVYLNRHWDGRFSRRISLENYYPLLAGVVDEERAKRMIATLHNGKKFWGEQPLSSIPRDDPSFAAQTAGRGSVWSVMNYLLYVGLKRYGFYNQAAELARRSSALALASWEKSGMLNDHYSSSDGHVINEPDNLHRTSFAGLMLWPGIEELISADPWSGMSIGSTTVTEESRLDRVIFSGMSFDVIFGPKRTIVRRNENIELECEGPVRLRGYRGIDHAINFAIETKERVRLLLPAIEGRKITVSVDDKVLGSTSPGAAASFKVPEGNHKVFIVK